MDVVVGEVEALRHVKIAHDGLRVAANLETIDCGEATGWAGSWMRRNEPLPLPLAWLTNLAKSRTLKPLAALKAAGERKIFLAWRDFLGVSPFRHADHGA